ncbi:MAG: acyl-CoA dehydrogenase, partial [Actinomycetota bacterium]|nr:acyl-CoA dehydrogenase [Actinomycetota bacterium]
MEFGFDGTTTELLARVQAFMDERVYPAESILEEQLATNPDSWAPPAI